MIELAGHSGAPSLGPRTRLRALGRVRVASRRRPEWWLFVIAAPGWAVLAFHGAVERLVGAGGQTTSSMRPGRRELHAMPDMPGMPGTGSGHASIASGLATAALMWAAMIAIMLALIAPNARFVALRSQHRQRLRNTAAVVAGWAGVWAIAAIVLAEGSSLAVRVVGRTSAIVVLFATAIVWQCTPFKRRTAAHCHRTFAPPLDPASGAPACRRFGVRLGADCVFSCWPLMAAMAAADHALLVVGPLFWVSWYERRRRPHHDRRPLTTITAIAVVGALALALPASGAWH